MNLEISTQAQHRKNLALGMGLVFLTMAYNAVEMFLALWAGFQDRSISLEAFGLDSIIELALGAVLLWRLLVEARGADEARIEQVERRANWWAGVVFYALAAVIAVGSVVTLWTRTESEPGPLGIGLAIASVIIMPIIATAKKRIGTAIDSQALKAEANCTWVCAYMSATLLIGLLATRYLGWWWADPLAALGILYWIVGEGREGFERAAGRDTCCSCSHD
ncbi:Cation efflux family protein [compost metagenome]